LNPTYNCTVVQGRIRVFLSDGNSVEAATQLVLTSIKAAFEDPNFVDRVGSGLMKITYLRGELEQGSGSSLETGGSIPGSPEKTIPQQSESLLPVASVVFVSVGSAALIVFIGSVYLWRRGRGGSVNATGSQDESDAYYQGGAATQMAGSSLDITTDNLKSISEDQPASPYSEMVSGCYKLGESMSILSNINGMSPVSEQDHEGSVSSASLVVSEGGYTAEAGYTDGDSTTYAGSKYSSHSAPMPLGARPLPGTIGDLEMDSVSDSDLDTSCEMSPVKIYVRANTNGKLLSTGNDAFDVYGDETEDDTLLFSPQEGNRKISPTAESDIETIDNNMTPRLFASDNEEEDEGDEEQVVEEDMEEVDESDVESPSLLE
jgi:hypothetical protein